MSVPIKGLLLAAVAAFAAWAVVARAEDRDAQLQASRPILSPTTPATQAVRRILPAAPRKPYRLLAFTGAPMKWGRPRLGASAVVTWRLARGTERFERARNCRSIEPIETALAPSGIERAAFLGELHAAMDAWQRVAGIRFRRTDDGEADLVIGAQSRPRGKAFTNVRADRTPKPQQVRVDRLAGSLICLNPTHPWKIGFDGNLKSYDLRHTLLHELGHVIGLDHTGASGSVMAFRYDEKHDGLTVGDVAGARKLYGLPRRVVARR